LANEIPVALQDTAAWLDSQGTEIAPAALMAQARQEIERLFPELDVSQRSMHAAVVADAVGAALAQPVGTNAQSNSNSGVTAPQGGQHA